MNGFYGALTGISVELGIIGYQVFSHTGYDDTPELLAIPAFTTAVGIIYGYLKYPTYPEITAADGLTANNAVTAMKDFLQYAKENPKLVEGGSIKFQRNFEGRSAWRMTFERSEPENAYVPTVTVLFKFTMPPRNSRSRNKR
jgi:hypothetical protein